MPLIHQGYFGIFCFNDELAYNALKVMNREIPNVRKVYPRLHIIGYDCVSTRSNGLMDLTSVDFDYDGICQKAISLLKDRFSNLKRDRISVKFPVCLHERNLF